jgi:quinolinate synthase
MNAHQNHANNHLIPDAETNVNLNDEVEVDDASTFCRDKPHNGDVVTYINKDSSANLTIVGGIVRKSIP